MIENKHRQIIQALFAIRKKLPIHVIQLDFSRANSKLLLGSHLTQIVLILVYSTYQSLHLFSLSQERCTITLTDIYHTNVGIFFILLL